MRQIIATALLALGFAAVVAGPALAVCRAIIDSTPTGTTAVLDCPKLDALDTQADLRNGTWVPVEELERAQRWPLGDQVIKDCEFCLDPNPQELERIKEAEAAAQQ